MTDKKTFEQALREHWQARNWQAWNSCRLVYGDWLEERGDALAPMARADFEIREVKIMCGFLDPPREVVSCWELLLKIESGFIREHCSQGLQKRIASHELLRPRWKRMNEKELFGIPRKCFRCRGFSRWDKAVKFVVHFRPRRGRFYFESAEQIHPLGFPRMFLDRNPLGPKAGQLYWRQ